jgi:hypothetical protein
MTITLAPRDVGEPVGAKIANNAGILRDIFEDYVNAGRSRLVPVNP